MQRKSVHLCASGSIVKHSGRLGLVSLYYSFFGAARYETHTNPLKRATFLQEAVTHTGHCVVPVVPVQMPSFPLYCVELYV